MTEETRKELIKALGCANSAIKEITGFAIHLIAARKAEKQESAFEDTLDQTASTIGDLTIAARQLEEFINRS